MTPVPESVRHLYSQSVDDLVRAQVILETLWTSHEKIDEALVRREDEERLEALTDHPLAPAMGVINGLKLSVVLWGVILLGVVLIW
jgi:hypothetical protein